MQFIMLNFRYHKSLDSLVTSVIPRKAQNKLVIKIRYWKDLGNEKANGDVNFEYFGNSTSFISVLIY